MRERIVAVLLGRTTAGSFIPAEVLASVVQARIAGVCPLHSNGRVVANSVDLVPQAARDEAASRDAIGSCESG